jgi:hypothetical protein
MRLMILLRAAPGSLVRAALLALAFTAAACGAPATSARIAHGEPVVTGDDTFDTFFREVAEVKAEADKGASELTDAARPLQDAIGAQSKNAPADVVRAAELLVRIADLERRRADLSSTLATSFPDQDKRAQVSRELTAAGDVLSAARTTGEKHAGSASKLALDLARALETGAGSASVAAAKKPPAKPAAPGGGKTGGTAPAKPRRDDFDR